MTTILVGDKITTLNYSTIKTTIDPLLTLYGLSSTSPTSSVGATVSSSEWISLRNDMISCRQFQTGQSIGTLAPTDPGYVAGFNLIPAMRGMLITQQFAQQYADFANYILLTANATGTSLFYTPGTTTFTIPANIYKLKIDAVGGGGPGNGWHDSGYNIVASAGGPGGGVQNLTLYVTPGNSLSVTVAQGGRSGFYNGGTGAVGSPNYSDVVYNGTQIFVANNGSGAGVQTAGAVGTASIYAGTGGSVVTGTKGTAYAGYGGVGLGYSIWVYIDNNSTAYPESGAGIPPITAPTGVIATSYNSSGGTSSDRAGRSEYSGWVSLNY